MHTTSSSDIAPSQNTRGTKKKRNTSRRIQENPRETKRNKQRRQQRQETSKEAGAEPFHSTCPFSFPKFERKDLSPVKNESLHANPCPPPKIISRLVRCLYHKQTQHRLGYPLAQHRMRFLAEREKSNSLPLMIAQEASADVAAFYHASVPE